jgi:ATP-dependent Clp protease ATP-binding subunit ClpA
MEGELEKLLKMEDRLHERLVGQDEAVAAVSDAIRRARAGLKDSKRPIGSFIFLGPTGVGKTELARALAEFLFDDDNALVRIDMSEYMEKFATSRLVGAPPGYVGYEEGGQLTEAVRRRPYQVVLFDEIEKAHPDVFNVLLQLLDDGRLTDSQGRTVDFKNTVIIMTSNVGSATLIEAAERGTDAFDKASDEVRAQLRDIFRPEFLNRVDEIIVFKPLGEEQLREIVGLLLDNVRRRLAESRLGLDVTDAARTFIAREGYDPIYGARPLRRAIQRLMENPLAKKILAGDFPAGSTVRVDVIDEQLTFESLAGPGGEPSQDGAGPTDEEREKAATAGGRGDSTG